jgi:hypothetical protein
MKKLYFFGSCLFFLALSFGFSHTVYAQTCPAGYICRPAEVAPVTVQSSSLPGNNEVCRLNLNLTIGDRDTNTNGQVSILQRFLVQQGLLRTNIYGNFLSGTAAALGNFQKPKRLLETPGYGYFGPVTRSYIRDMYGCDYSNPSTPIPTILSVGGDKVTVAGINERALTAGVRYTIIGQNLNNLTQLYLQASNSNVRNNLEWARDNTSNNPIFYLPNSPQLTNGYYNLYAVNPSGTSASFRVYIVANSSTSSLPAIQVISPNGGETLQKGQTYTIRWSTQNISSSQNIAIGLLNRNPTEWRQIPSMFLSTDVYTYDPFSPSASTYPNNRSVLSTFSGLPENVSNNGIYSWTVPSHLPSGSSYYLTVTENRQNGSFDFSNGMFTISGQNQNNRPHITRVSAKAAADFEAYVGEDLAIEGNYLAGNFVSTTNVYLGGIKAIVTQASDNLLIINTPQLNPGTYPLYVSNEKGQSNSVMVKVYRRPTTTISPPHITRISAKAAADFEIYVGEEFTIEGNNLVSSATENVEIYVGGKKAALKTSGGGLLHAATPDLNSGTYDLYVLNSRGQSNIVKVKVQGRQTNVTNPTLTITLPSGGATFKNTDTILVNWLYNYSPNGNPTKVILYNLSTNAYDWQSSQFYPTQNPGYLGIPLDASKIGKYKIGVCDYNKTDPNYGGTLCGWSGEININPVVFPIQPPQVIPAPTANLTVNGSKNVTVNAGEVVTYRWNSTNGAIFRSSYTSTNNSTGATCGSGSWTANNNSGVSNETIITGQANCTVVVTYTVVGATGNATDQVTIKVNPIVAVIPSPTASLTVNGAKDITVSAGDTVNYSWGSTNGAIFSSTYTNSCTPGAVGEWSANTGSGNSSGVIDQSQAGCTYVITYKVVGVRGNAESSITIRVRANNPFMVALTQQEKAAQRANVLLAISNFIKANPGYMFGNALNTLKDLFKQLESLK